MMVCTAIYMYIDDICRYLYPINWQHQGLLTYFCQAIHMSCSHKRPLVLFFFFVTPHGPSGVVRIQSLGIWETWWHIAKFTWQIYRKHDDNALEFWVLYPSQTHLPRLARKPCLLSSEANANLWPLRQVHCVGVEPQLMWQTQSHKHQWRCLLSVFCEVMGDGLWMNMNYKVYFSLQLVFTTSMIYGSFGMSICFPFKYMKTILFIFLQVL